MNPYDLTPYIEEREAEKRKGRWLFVLTIAAFLVLAFYLFGFACEPKIPTCEDVECIAV